MTTKKHWELRNINKWEIFTTKNIDKWETLTTERYRPMRNFDNRGFLLLLQQPIAMPIWSNWVRNSKKSHLIPDQILYPLTYLNKSVIVVSWSNNQIEFLKKFQTILENSRTHSCFPLSHPSLHQMKLSPCHARR